jgi:hypothetical protein
MVVRLEGSERTDDVVRTLLDMFDLDVESVVDLAMEYDSEDSADVFRCLECDAISIYKVRPVDRTLVVPTGSNEGQHSNFLNGVKPW